MKTILLFGSLLLTVRFSAAAEQPPQTPPSPTPYAVKEREANHRVVERTVYERGPQGQFVAKKQTYTGLATGMNYLKDGQWVESKEEIKILQDGTAAATEGQHQAYFPVNILQGVVESVTPDGQHLKSHPLGLSYFDRTNSVLIAELTNSIGQLVGLNQIIYTNAFTTFGADVRYTYTKAGFEQDIILREQPPSPALYGLNPQTTVLEVLTEFFDTPEPVQTQRAINQRDGLRDTTLTFGRMKMGRGKAFTIGDSSPIDPRLRGIPVYKNWAHLEGRTFLFEDMSYPRIEPQLEQLPIPANGGVAMNSANSLRNKASAKRTLPPARLVQTVTNTMQIAKAELNPQPGVVLDWANNIALDSDQTNYTFVGDSTYHISGYVHLTGVTTFEGGAVIKNDDDGQIDVDEDSTIVCKTGPYHPTVFTSINDDTIGIPIDGSSGSPTSGEVGAFIITSCADTTLRNMRFAFPSTAVAAWDESAHNLDFWDCQIVGADACVAVADANIGLHNVLLSEGCGLTPIRFYGSGNLIAENVTSDGYSDMYFLSGGTASLTNCLITDGLWVSVDGGTGVSVADPIYQTVGAGNYYLATNSPFRNAGTMNISSQLLAGFREQTTYPPIVYAGTNISGVTTFSPQAQHDMDTPDLGYHYAPLDYVFSAVDVHSNITFTAGTAIGWYNDGSGYGIGLAEDYITLTFDGTVSQPCIHTTTSAVQEGSAWNSRSATGGIVGRGQTDDQAYAPHVNAKFTYCSTMFDGNFFRDDSTPVILHANNCEFVSGGMGGYSMAMYLTNSLMNRTYLAIQASGSPALVMRNCTMLGVFLIAQHGSPWPVYIVNCAFDGTETDMDDPSGGNTNILYCNYNAFLNGANRLPMLGADDVIVTSSFNWQTGPLGYFYEPTNSPLINKGSATSDLVGLYHFTTQINQVKETNSIVDIGYHYVALNSNGNPIDTDGDGIPDYLEDANGNGNGSDDATSWLIYNYFSDLIYSKGLQVFTPLK